MNAIRCPQCGGEMHAQEGRTPRLCPYCGTPLPAETAAGPSALQERLRGVRDPRKRYKILCEALAQDPDSFEANEALLYHGRLHEPLRAARGGGIDYSLIKCHLFSAFDTPEKYSAQALREKYDELLRGEQLLRTMALAPDAEAFFDGYLHRLAFEYIDLFLREDSRNAHVLFSFHRSQDSVARRCAAAAERMLENIRACGELDDRQRAVLLSAVRAGYERVFPGHTLA